MIEKKVFFIVCILYIVYNCNGFPQPRNILETLKDSSSFRPVIQPIAGTALSIQQTDLQEYKPVDTNPDRRNWLEILRDSGSNPIRQPIPENSLATVKPQQKSRKSSRRNKMGNWPNYDIQALPSRARDKRGTDTDENVLNRINTGNTMQEAIDNLYTLQDRLKQLRKRIEDRITELQGSSELTTNRLRKRSIPEEDIERNTEPSIAAQAHDVINKLQNDLNKTSNTESQQFIDLIANSSKSLVSSMNYFINQLQTEASKVTPELNKIFGEIEIKIEETSRNLKQTEAEFTNTVKEAREGLNQGLTIFVTETDRLFHAVKDETIDVAEDVKKIANSAYNQVATLGQNIEKEIQQTVNKHDMKIMNME